MFEAARGDFETAWKAVSSTMSRRLSRSPHREGVHPVEIYHVGPRHEDADAVAERHIALHPDRLDGISKKAGKKSAVGSGKKVPKVVKERA